MSRTINRVELLGRVGANPEMRYSQTGTAITTLRMATDRRRQNGDTEADWHSIVCWGKQAEAVAEYVRKGNRLYVSGSLAQNTFETEEGQRIHRTEIHAQEVVFLDSNGRSPEQGEDVETAGSEPAAKPAATGPTPF
ncbi:MAG: single-stranded DNA-binding protein [Dehalococcoidia bacterium]|nr:single-stranded DNA-binding protein [Dehalococcoidia bacterium]